MKTIQAPKRNALDRDQSHDRLRNILKYAGISHPSLEKSFTARLLGDASGRPVLVLPRIIAQLLVVV